MLIRAVDALHDQSHIPDDLWDALAIAWSHPELLEIVAIVGYYHLISFICNSCALRWNHGERGSFLRKKWEGDTT